jgi:chloramphenicol O-acetyltransferase type A
LDLDGSLSDFVKLAKETSAKQKNYFDYTSTAGRDDLIYITCIPWVSFTHLSHTILINKNDSVPRISWGKFFIQDGKTLLPFSVQVHHAFVDGMHVGQYFEKLQKYLDTNELK